MKAQRRASVLYFALLLALVSGATRSRGYTNLIEGGSTVTVTDFWNVGSNVDVGNVTQNNSLIISAGGQVMNAGKTYLGHCKLSHCNSVTITGNGSVWDSFEDFYVGYEGSSNLLTVADGGQVHTDRRGYVGYLATAANNTVLVTGGGSVWETLYGVRVGYYGEKNALTIAEGARVSSGSYFGGVGIIGECDLSDSNTVLVTGDGSAWKNYGLVVGQNGGNNSLTIADGGQVYSRWGSVGRERTADNNSVLVTGDGSVWEGITHGFSIGRKGAGNALTIADGGQVHSDRDTVGTYAAADNNSVLVTGSGSVWSNCQLTVGFYGDRNALTIADGGAVYNIDEGHIGNKAGSDRNEAVVTGHGSRWINDGLVAGKAGDNNTLTITGGGQVYSTWGVVGYERTADNNTALVAGGGSVWSNNGLYVAYYGGVGNALMIADGGQVYSTTGAVGVYPGADDNVVMVSGEESLLCASAALRIGNSGNSGNALVVVSNAVVSAASVTVRNNNSVHLGSGGALMASGFFANANLRMYISGTTPSDYGHLSVNGGAYMIGKLEVIVDGFTPFYGDVFDLFDWNGGVLYGFTDIDLPALPPGFWWNTDALYTTGELSVDADMMPADCIVMPPVNLSSIGRWPVSILSTNDFDATVIDPASVECVGVSPAMYLLADLNEDGSLDLKLFFNVFELPIGPDDSYVELIAQDYAGQYMVGLPQIRIVPDS